MSRLEEFQGGVWMMVDIDTDRIRSNVLRLNIPLPDPLAVASILTSSSTL
ncbi:MAG: type II toxin-antitoxin system HicB family antitoxin [Magnetococcales bacterium]|nr:type II toxin-antitoxin system HicB family antitoxin [Magnetococcales bacterium]